MLIHQTQTRPQENLDLNLTEPREAFSFKPLINLGVDSNWMIGLISLEVNNSNFNITEKKQKK